MSQRPKISLIIPVFNTEKYLDDCLSSAVNQTLHDIEIICIDDKSNDNSLEILKKYAKQDKRLKIIEKDFSSGAGDCRNRGLELAQGEYVLFIDSDDKIKTEACEELYNEAQKYDADICIFGAEFYNTETQHSKINSLATHNFPQKVVNVHDVPNKIFSLCLNAPWDKLFKRAFLNQHNLRFQNLRSCNDVAFTCLSMAYAKKITYFNKTLYTYRMNTGTNISATRGKFCFNALLAYAFVCEELQKKSLFNLVEKSFYSSCSASFRSEYNLAPAKYKPYFLDEIKKFLPTMKFLKNFSLDRPNGIVSLRERHIVFTFGRMTFKFKKSTFFLRLFYLCFRKKLGRFNSFEKLSFKEYEQSILKTYKELTGDNLYFASNLDIK